MRYFAGAFTAASCFCLTALPVGATEILKDFNETDVSVGGNFFVGYQFTANQDLAVNFLGFWDDGQDGLLSSHNIGIFDLAGNLLGSVTAGPGNTTLFGVFQYAALAAPINLSGGQSYQIGGTTAGLDGWVFQGTNLTTEGVTYNGSRFRSDGSFGPLNTAASTRQYFTVNAATTLGAVPEPSTWAMLLLGFFAVGGALRSNRRRQTVSVSYA